MEANFDSDLLVGSIDGDGADIQNCTVGVAGKETGYA